MNKNNICNNCGKQGHQFHQCKLPITSYGVIVFRLSSKGRKDSFGYIDFIRGKYSLYNLCQLNTMIDEMSLDEKNRILSLPFETLWNEMWGETYGNNQYKSEENASKKKLELLREGVMIDNKKEKDLDCALREFEEETGLSKKNIRIIENLLPFEEMFLGSNNKSYKHKYFLAYKEDINESLNNYQKTEVSKIDWKTLEE